MAKQKEKKQTPVSRLMEYAGSFQYLAVASWVLAAVSAFVALVPFYFIWRLIKEVLRVGSIPSAGKYEVKTDATYLISADWIYG